MDVVIIEIYQEFDENNELSYSDIENVYGPFSDKGINEKIIELENLRKSYNTTFEIMPLIKNIK